ncbi:hypothetical protein BN1723_017677, partial [Verticillium longisporum]
AHLDYPVAGRASLQQCWGGRGGGIEVVASYPGIGSYPAFGPTSRRRRPSERLQRTGACVGTCGHLAELVPFRVGPSPKKINDFRLQRRAYQKQDPGYVRRAKRKQNPGGRLSASFSNENPPNTVPYHIERCLVPLLRAYWFKRLPSSVQPPRSDARWALWVTGRWPNLLLEQRETTRVVEADQLTPRAGLSSRGALASHSPPAVDAAW